MSKLLIILLAVLQIQASGQTVNYKQTGQPAQANPSGKAINFSYNYKSGEFSYSISTVCISSAGVYKTDSTLVRTLWNNKGETVGIKTFVWDGKDDDGNIMPDGNYRVHVLSNNLKAEWGVIGNSSEVFTGPTVHNEAYGEWQDMCVANGKIFFTVFYNEGRHGEYYVDKDKIQIKKYLWPEDYGYTGFASQQTCSDGVYVYFAGPLPGFGYDTLKSGIYKRNISNNAVAAFENGIPITSFGGTIFSMIDTVKRTFNYKVDGLAAQKNGVGNFIFCSRRVLNSLHVLHKNGTLMQSIAINAPSALDCDAAGNVWIISGTSCKKYSVNSSTGALTEMLTLSGLVEPVAVAVNPGNGYVYVADAGTSQQVKIYGLEGQLVTTFGQLGGYANSPTVANNKFMFRDIDLYYPGDPNNSIKYAHSNICFDSTDNSWWLVDVGNSRNLHFSSNNTWIETFMCLGNNFSTGIDANDSSRYFSNYLEFKIDYSKTLDNGSNGSWALINNWAIDTSLWYADNTYERLMGVTTLSNGRTYAINPGLAFELVELSPTGLRLTGLFWNRLNYSHSLMLQKDGSLWEYFVDDDSTYYKRRPLTGFDGSHNPQWDDQIIIAKVVSNNYSPVSGFEDSKRANQIFSDGTIAAFNNSRATGPHLGAIRPNTNKFIWQTSYSTHTGVQVSAPPSGSPWPGYFPYQYRGQFPSEGTYDISNGVNYAGSSLQVLGKVAVWGYKGEFWKNSQANYFNLFHRIGLMLFQFGTDGIKNLHQKAAYGMAGNMKTMAMTKQGDSVLYVLANDEYGHGALQRWKITGLSTIKEQVINIVKSSTPVLPNDGYANLMEGLPFNDTITNGAGGWTYVDLGTHQPIATNRITFQKDKRDLFIKSKAQLTKQLPVTASTDYWELKGQLQYAEYQQGPSDTNYLEILDTAYRVIARLSKTDSFPNNYIKIGSKIIVSGIITPVVNVPQDFSIQLFNNNIIARYRNYAPVLLQQPENSQANRYYPKYVRFTHNQNAETNLINLKFQLISSF